MTINHPNIWETLFTRALDIIDNAVEMGMPKNEWSFGGGTALMLRYQHRFSKDVDIFVSDPQYITAFSPRINDRAEEESKGYDEQHQYVKLYYPEGEIDFVAAPSVTSMPYCHQEILGRIVKTETPLEIVAKKIFFRADQFKARDMYDLALVIERESEHIREIVQLLKEKKVQIQERIRLYEDALREDFMEIDTLTYTPTFDHCLGLIYQHLN